MSDLFWQRPWDSWTYETVSGFLSDQVPEYDRLEYKAPVPGKDGINGRWELADDVLKTIVSMANTSGGMIFYGIGSGEGNKPGKIVGFNASDPERTLRSKCAAQIEPTLWLDTKVLSIPNVEEGGDKKLLLVRLHAGNNPPYSLRRVGVFVRTGEEDRQASVRDLEALFARRTYTPDQTRAHWSDVALFNFAYASQDRAREAPVVLVGLTPHFPGEPVEIDDRVDGEFARLCDMLFEGHHALIETSHGVFYDPYQYQQALDPTSQPDGSSYACAYDDGSVGLRRKASYQYHTLGGPPRQLELAPLWSDMRALLTAAERWCRHACRVEGPLRYQLSVGNLVDAVVTLPSGMIYEPTDRPLFPVMPNRLPSWTAQGEWEQDETIDDLIERQLGSLARQLQCSFYRGKQAHIRARSHQV